MRTLLRLGPFLRPYRLQVALALGVTLVLTFLLLLVPAIIRQVIDVGLVQSDGTFLLAASLALLAIGGLRSVLVYVQRYLSEWIASHIGYDLRNRLYDHIQYLPFSFHDHSQTGQLISRCIEDVRAVERFTGFGVIELIRLALLMLGITGLLFYQSPELASIALLPMIPLVLVTTAFGRRVGDFFLKVDIALGDLSSRVQENVTGVQVVRAFAREPYEIDRFAGKNRELYRARVRVVQYLRLGHAHHPLPGDPGHHPDPVVWRQDGDAGRDDHRRAGGFQQLSAAAGGAGPAAHLAGQRGGRSGGRSAAQLRDPGPGPRNPQPTTGRPSTSPPGSGGVSAGQPALSRPDHRSAGSRSTCASSRTRSSP